MPGTSAQRRWLGLLCYLALTFASSWSAALLLRQVGHAAELPTPVRLVLASVVYALSMGWQPLVALWIVRKWVDPGDLDSVFRHSKREFYSFAVVGPLLLVSLATLVAVLTTGGSDPAAPASTWVSPRAQVLLVLAGATCLAWCLIWLQALAEEVGWRGYFLTRFMQQVGPIRGLCLHGVIWGIWYAPILLMTQADLRISSFRSASFVLTCMLLGGLLGWLRLASTSVLPTALANSLLTVTAGLPFLLQGEDPGVRAAVYGPAGWIPMATVLALLLSTKYRDVVRLPTFAHSSQAVRRGTLVERQRHGRPPTLH